MSLRLTRGELLSRGARGGVVALAAGAGAGAFASEASAVAPPASDLAYLRLLIGAELLAIDFFTQAATTKQLPEPGARYLKLALTNETDHYRALAFLLAAAGGTPLTAADVNFTYPAGSFGSRHAIIALAVVLETLTLGAYLGAASAIQTSALTLPLAQIIASEGEHLSAFSAQSGVSPIGASFPAPLSIEQASDALDTYTS